MNLTCEIERIYPSLARQLQLPCQQTLKPGQKGRPGEIGKILCKNACVLPLSVLQTEQLAKSLEGPAKILTRDGVSGCI